LESNIITSFSPASCGVPGDGFPEHSACTLEHDLLSACETPCLHEDTFLRPSAVFTAAFRYWEIARSCSILSSMALVEDVASRSVAPEVFNRACICSGDPEQVTH
jgi:hypothetical protein